MRQVKLKVAEFAHGIEVARATYPEAWTPITIKNAILEEIKKQSFKVEAFIAMQMYDQIPYFVDPEPEPISQPAEPQTDETPEVYEGEISEDEKLDYDSRDFE